MIVQIVKGRAQFRGIENAVLANMTPEQLAVELDRVKSDQRKHEMILKGAPRWARAVPENRKQAHCLSCERRRIERELERRFEALRTAGEVMSIADLMTFEQWQAFVRSGGQVWHVEQEKAGLKEIAQVAVGV